MNSKILLALAFCATVCALNRQRIELSKENTANIQKKLATEFINSKAKQGFFGHTDDAEELEEAREENYLEEANYRSGVKHVQNFVMDVA